MSSAPIVGRFAVAAAMVLTGCLGPMIPGECTDEERAAFETIDHFGGDPLTPDDDPLGGCRATFTSDAGADEVIDHYESAFRTADWVLDRTYRGPIKNENGDVVGTTVAIAARKGSIASAVEAELFDGEPGRWIVIVRHFTP